MNTLHHSLSKADLIDRYSEALGVEKATALIEEAIRAKQLSDSDKYGREEVMALAEYLKQKGGFIKILANCLASDAYRLETDK